MDNTLINPAAARLARETGDAESIRAALRLAYEFDLAIRAAEGALAAYRRLYEGEGRHDNASLMASAARWLDIENKGLFDAVVELLEAGSRDAIEFHNQRRTWPLTPAVARSVGALTHSFITISIRRAQLERIEATLAAVNAVGLEAEAHVDLARGERG